MIARQPKSFPSRCEPEWERGHRLDYIMRAEFLCVVDECGQLNGVLPHAWRLVALNLLVKLIMYHISGTWYVHTTPGTRLKVFIFSWERNPWYSDQQNTINMTDMYSCDKANRRYQISGNQRSVGISFYLKFRLSLINVPIQLPRRTNNIKDCIISELYKINDLSYNDCIIELYLIIV